VNTKDVGPTTSELEFVRRQVDAYDAASSDLRTDMERSWFMQLPAADASHVTELLWLLQHAYAVPLFEFATRRVGSPDDAYIVVFNTFLAIARARSTATIRTSPLAFFFAAVRTEALRFLHAQALRTTDARSPDDDDAPAPPSHIDAARLTLTELQALIIELRCVFAFTLPEIADITNRTVYDVRHTLADAAQILRRAF
jgi:DNA-directed RNA polymerase specialized sigma24 family protein